MSVFAQQPSTASESPEKIIDYSTVIHINEDSTIKILERIIYDFSDNHKHGIFRDIPLKTNGRNLAISDIAVKDEKGNEHPFAISEEGSKIRIQIGNPVSTVTGVHTYALTYKVSGAIGYFKDFDEIYWNVIGNDWTIPILKSQAVIYLPKAAPAVNMKASCYIGKIGNTETCPIEENTVGEKLQDVDYVIFTPTRTLYPKEGLTAAVGFPKGMVKEPTAKENIVSKVKVSYILIFPIIAFLVMFAVWYKKGRDPKGTGVIIPQYDSPDDLKPIEISGIIHQKIKDQDISAELIYLATKGYLKITRTKEKILFISSTDYTFTKLKDWSDLPDEFDRKLLKGIFGEARQVNLSDLKDKFYKEVGEIKNESIISLIKKGYYKLDPSRITALYFIAGIVIGGAVIFLSGFLSQVFGTLSGIATGIIIVLFGLVMPKKTVKGMAVYEYILGLKEYLQIAEKDRINFHNAPAKTPEIFEKFLPYAMTLKVEKAWAKEFADIYQTPPSWYSDNSGTAFNAIIFSHSLSQFNSQAAGAFTSSPGSGSHGGGSSGGGGGGGGGGSW